MRVHHQRARDIDALAHAARQLMRIVIGKTAQAHKLDQRQRPLVPLLLAELGLEVEAIHDVLRHGAPREQAVVLEHHGAIGTRSMDSAAIDQHLPGGNRDQAIDSIEERGLAAAAGPDDARPIRLRRS